MDLTSENVEKVFMDCLSRVYEPKGNFIKAEGITFTISFHPGRLDNHKEDVRSMLSCLPKNFHKDHGGGWSFLNACDDKDGNQWTDLHRIMEQLFMLGIALDLAKWQMLRPMWSHLPGGVPYVVIL